MIGDHHQVDHDNDDRSEQAGNGKRAIQAQPCEDSGRDEEDPKKPLTKSQNPDLVTDAAES